MNSPDVIIIGAGIIGCATAFELSKAGYKTLNIDKNSEPGAGSTAQPSSSTSSWFAKRATPLCPKACTPTL